MATKLGIAVIGLGVGEQHALAYRRDHRCELVWLYDLDSDRADAVAAGLGKGRTADSLEQVLADPSVQVISIASYDDAHFEQVTASLDAGKHVFVEKPLCRSLNEARTIRALWEKNGKLRLGSNLVLRASPLYIWLRQAIQSGLLGQIYAFDGEYLYGRLHKITEGWRKDVENYSVMLGGGVHMVDLMLWLTGQRPVSVGAVGNRICSEGTAFRFNDYLAATYEFASGLVGRITANFGCVHAHQHVVRVYGTRGTFLYDDRGQRLHISPDPAEPSIPKDFAPLPDTKGDLIPEFIDSILSAESTDESTQHEFDVISACVAADRAETAGKAIAIEYA